MGNPVLRVKEESQLMNRHRSILSIVLMSVLICTAWTGKLFGQTRPERAGLTLGGVGYGDGWDGPLTQLIAYLNKELGLATSIRDRPALLSYENAVTFASQDQLDIALLTPLVFTKAKLESKGASLEPVAITLMEADDKPSRLFYNGVIYAGKRVDPKTLMLREGGKATIALIPNSSSGYLYPLKAIADHLRKNGTGIETSWEGISNHFDVRISQSHSESLRMFFAAKDPVDIIAVYDLEPKLFLREPDKNYAQADRVEVQRDLNDFNAKLELVGEWIKHNRCERPFNRNSLDAFFKKKRVDIVLPELLKSCERLRTEDIPGDVIVVNNPGHVPDLSVRVKRALEKLNSDFAKPSIPGSLLQLRRLLKNRRGIVGFYTDSKSIESLYLTVSDFYEKHRTLENRFGTDAAAIVSNIAYDMRWRKSHGDPARLAVVLSGGGASGAYQAGALIELQNALHKFRINQSAAFNHAFTPSDLRVSMFVGTSVGAINTVAAALTQVSGKVEEDLTRLWDPKVMNGTILRGTSENPDYVFWVYWLFHVLNKGWLFALAALALLQIYLFLKICDLLAQPILKLNAHAMWGVLVTVLVLNIVLLYVSRSLGMVMLHLVAVAAIAVASKLSLSKAMRWVLIVFGVTSLHSLYEVWSDLRKAVVSDEWLQFNIWVALFMLIVSTVAVGNYLVRVTPVANLLHGYGKRFPSLATAWRATQLTAQTGVFIMAPVLVMHLLIHNRSFFDPKPLEALLLNQYQSLAGIDPATTATLEPREKSEAVSKQILQKLRASDIDLVVTATDFTNYQEGIQPREIYFYSSKRKLKDIRDVSDRNAERWVDMSDDIHETQLLDMVMASAAIFPGFPPHQLKSLKVTSAAGASSERRQYELIDGGFLHNVPVQAAVEMGATHIVIIQVQPLAGKSQVQKIRSAGLGSNLYAAFELLFERAQSADTDAVAEQRTFVLAPSRRRINVLDFDGHYGGLWNKEQNLSSFLDRGRLDATLKGYGSDVNLKKLGFQQISIGKLFREPRWVE
jgi:predicted acylesterase/phospholipase RssA